MKRRQFGVCAAMCVMSAGATLVSLAQQPMPAAAPVEKPQRPQGEALRVEALPAELEALLKTWEQKSAQIKTLTGKHQRSEFNDVFQVETRTEGKFFFEAPDKGRIDMAGIKVKPGEVGVRKDANGKPYRLQGGHDERWICTGQEVLQINDQAKELDVIPIPKEFQGRNIMRSPLPFLFGLKAEEAKKRFEFQLMKPGPSYHTLQVIPRTNQDAFSKAYVKLDKKLFVPTGVRLLDLAGGGETWYDFSDLEINNQGIANVVGELFGRDPFKPTLTGYKRVQRPVVPAGANIPNGQKVPIRPAVQKQDGTPTPSAPARSATAPPTNKPAAPPSKSAINR